MLSYKGISRVAWEKLQCGGRSAPLRTEPLGQQSPWECQLCPPSVIFSPFAFLSASDSNDREDVIDRKRLSLLSVAERKAANEKTAGGKQN